MKDVLVVKNSGPLKAQIDDVKKAERLLNMHEKSKYS